MRLQALVVCCICLQSGLPLLCTACIRHLTFTDLVESLKDASSSVDHVRGGRNARLRRSFCRMILKCSLRILFTLGKFVL